MKGLGLHNQDPQAPVSLIHWEYGKDRVAEAIDRCEGFKGLDRRMDVVIKPNLVGWVDKYRFSPFGILTTSVVVDGVVKALKDFGVSKITIAEGTAIQKEMGCETHIIYDRLHYDYLTKKYGARFVDLNQETHVKTELGPFSLRIAERILNAEYLVDLPALKTHSITKVTLGFKNLKGCLHQSSKKKCHNPEHAVDEYVAYLGAKLYPQLVVVDGLYALERGPMYTGNAHRAELLLAGRDMFSVDCVGARVLGFDPNEILHLHNFAKLQGRQATVEGIEVRGLNLDENVLNLAYDSAWSQDGTVPEVFERQGIKGVQMRNPGQSMCTGCSKVYPALLMMLLAAYPGKPYDNIEILSGKGMGPSGTAKTSYFLGNCNYTLNRKAPGVNEGVWLKGCPPDISEMIEVFNARGIHLSEEANKRFYAHKVKVAEKQGFPFEDFYFPKNG